MGIARGQIYRSHICICGDVADARHELKLTVKAEGTAGDASYSYRHIAMRYTVIHIQASYFLSLISV
jgi:hypothetical protein